MRAPPASDSAAASAPVSPSSSDSAACASDSAVSGGDAVAHEDSSPPLPSLGNECTCVRKCMDKVAYQAFENVFAKRLAEEQSINRLHAVQKKRQYLDPSTFHAQEGTASAVIALLHQKQRVIEERAQKKVDAAAAKENRKLAKQAAEADREVGRVQ